MTRDIMIDENTALLFCILNKSKHKQEKFPENVTMQIQLPSWYILIESLQFN